VVAPAGQLVAGLSGGALATTPPGAVLEAITTFAGRAVDLLALSEVAKEKYDAYVKGRRDHVSALFAQIDEANRTILDLRRRQDRMGCQIR